MTESAPLTLDDVRLRFLEAQSQLADAGSAVEAIRQSSERLGAARDGLAGAGAEVARLAERFGAVADNLAENADRLHQGVEAIRLGDPAAIRREIEELDAAFTAMQGVFGDRLKTIETALARIEASAQAQRRERLIIAAITIIAVVIVGVLVLAR